MEALPSVDGGGELPNKVAARASAADLCGEADAQGSATIRGNLNVALGHCAAGGTDIRPTDLPIDPLAGPVAPSRPTNPELCSSPRARRNRRSQKLKLCAQNIAVRPMGLGAQTSEALKL